MKHDDTCLRPEHVRDHTCAHLNGTGPPCPFRSAACSRRRDCHCACNPSPSLLKRLLEGEGGAAEWQSR